MTYEREWVYIRASSSLRYILGHARERVGRLHVESIHVLHVRLLEPARVRVEDRLVRHAAPLVSVEGFGKGLGGGAGERFEGAAAHGPAGGRAGRGGQGEGGFGRAGGERA